MSRKHTLIKGTFILTATGFATRFMGFFYRIFLSHAFGEEGVGLYQLIFPIYALCFSFTAAGIETALSRCVARRLTCGQKKEARELLYTSIIFTVALSCIVTILLQYYAPLLSIQFLKDERCTELLVLLSYAFPFAAVHSCIVGYYLGAKETGVPAISQLIEQAVRILSVYLIYRFSLTQENETGVILAVAGLIFGEIASSFYCLFRIRRGSFLAPIKQVKPSAIFFHGKELLFLSCPLTANRVLLNVLQSVESISIPIRLEMFGMLRAEALSTYGVLTGMALPCILFPSAITNSVSTMLLPTVAEIQALNDKREMSSIIQKSVYYCIFLGSACCVFLLAFGDFIGVFLFHSPLAGKFITAMSWLCPFLYTNNTLISILNGIGKTYLSFAINSLSLGIRIASVFIFIPLYGIFGYLWGLLASQIFVFLFCLGYMYRYIHR
ncbi:polysaccharide biosynthesis protein [Lachnospiraceae bacterium 42-17]|jgi:stage V sporulation protein B|nr:polysaccharide biosynthesis protein [Dorea sp.]